MDAPPELFWGDRNAILDLHDGAIALSVWLYPTPVRSIQCTVSLYARSHLLDYPPHVRVRPDSARSARR